MFKCPVYNYKVMYMTLYINHTRCLWYYYIKLLHILMLQILFGKFKDALSNIFYISVDVILNRCYTVLFVLNTISTERRFPSSPAAFLAFHLIMTIMQCWSGHTASSINIPKFKISLKKMTYNLFLQQVFIS